MALFEQKSLSIAATYVNPNVELKGTSAPAGVDPSELDNDSIVPSAMIPAAYYINPVDEKFAWGIGMHTDYGLKSEFPTDYPAGAIAGSTEIVSMNLNTSLSYRINNHFSIGGGLNIIYAEGELTRNAGHNPIGLPAELELANMEGDDIAFGFNLGAVYEVDQNHRFGLSYRSSTELTLDGSYSNQLPAQFGGLGGEAIDGSMDIELPAIAEFSGFHQLTPHWAAHYSVMWTGWSSFDVLEAVDNDGNTLFRKDENFENSYRFSVGLTYNYSSALILRAGLAYDESPAPRDHRSISIPDSDRIWYSAGATYLLSAAQSFDLGLTLVDAKSADIVETDDFGQTWGFASQADVHLVSVQYNHSF
jgi:long-chain fatty acid transport protein